MVYCSRVYVYLGQINTLCVNFLVYFLDVYHCFDHFIAREASEKIQMMGKKGLTKMPTRHPSRSAPTGEEGLSFY